MLYEHNILDEESPVDFSGCELVAFIGCSTAASVEDGYNIAQAAVAAGAAAAIGFEESIEYDYANAWLNAFITNYYYDTERHVARAFFMTKEEVYGGNTDSAKLIPNQSAE